MPFGKIVARQKPMLNKLVIWSNTTSHRILRLGWIGLLVVSLPSGYLATAGFKADVFGEQGLNFYAIFPSLVIFISNIVISIFANFSHQRLEKRMNSRLADSDTLLANGDLEKAVGMSIAVLLVDTSTHPHVTKDTKAWILTHQGKIPDLWHEIVNEEKEKKNTDWFKELLPDKLSDIIKNRPQPLVETKWYEILKRLGDKAGAPFPGNEKTPDTVALVARLSKEFCKVFWEYIKEDSVNQGYAAKALELIIQREILKKLDHIHEDIQRLQATGNEIQATVVSIEKKVDWLSDQTKLSEVKKNEEVTTKILTYYTGGSKAIYLSDLNEMFHGVPDAMEKLVPMGWEMVYQENGIVDENTVPVTIVFKNSRVSATEEINRVLGDIKGRRADFLARLSELKEYEDALDEREKLDQLIENLSLLKKRIEVESGRCYVTKEYLKDIEARVNRLSPETTEAIRILNVSGMNSKQYLEDIESKLSRLHSEIGEFRTRPHKDAEVRSIRESLSQLDKRILWLQKKKEELLPAD